MFQTLSSADKRNIVHIQGSRITEDPQDISGLKLRNYDRNTSNYYDLSALLTQNSSRYVTPGTGELIFKTSSNGTLRENMRLDYLGRLGINTSNPVDTLDVDGVAVVRSNMRVPRIELSTHDTRSRAPVAENLHIAGSPPSRDVAKTWFASQYEFDTVGDVNQRMTKLRVQLPLCSKHVYKAELSYRVRNLTNETKPVRVIGKYTYFDNMGLPCSADFHEAVIASQFIKTPKIETCTSPVTTAVAVIDLRDAYDEINYDMDLFVELEFSALQKEKLDHRDYGIDQAHLIVTPLTL